MSRDATVVNEPPTQTRPSAPNRTEQQICRSVVPHRKGGWLAGWTSPLHPGRSLNSTTVFQRPACRAQSTPAPWDAVQKPRRVWKGETDGGLGGLVGWMGAWQSR